MDNQEVPPGEKIQWALNQVLLNQVSSTENLLSLFSHWLHLNVKLLNTQHGEILLITMGLHDD